MAMRHPFCAFGRALVVALVVTSPGVARADTINIGLGWQVTAPAGYLPQPDGPVGQLENFNTTAALPIKLVVPNWNTMAPIDIKFTQTTKAGANTVPNDFFMLRLQITNATKVPWGGFSFFIFDNNQTPQDGKPNLMHPFKAHYHFTFLDAGTVRFKSVYSQPNYGTDINDLSDRGVYSFTLKNDFLIKPADVWSPKFFDIHDRGKTDDKGNYITSFTLRLQPLKAPEPSTFLTFLVGGIGALGLVRRRTARVKSKG
jgi:hypothetical protein